MSYPLSGITSKCGMENSFLAAEQLTGKFFECLTISEMGVGTPPGEKNETRTHISGFGDHYSNPLNYLPIDDGLV